MKTIKILLSIIATAYLFCNFSCTEMPIDITEPPTDTIDSIPADTCNMPMPIYYEYDRSLFECMNMPRPCDSYNYPTYPGIEGWNHSAFEYNCNTLISTEMAKSMSTQALIQAYWEFPLLIDIIIGYTYFFKKYFADNDFYKELLLREDACEALLSRFVLIDHTYYKIDSTDRLDEKIGGVIAPKAFELLISQFEFLDRYSDSEKIIIIETTLKNDSLRNRMSTLHSLTRTTAFYLIGRVLISANYMPFIDSLYDYSQNGYSYSYFYGDFYSRDFDKARNSIINYAKQYLNEQKGGSIK